MELCAEQWMAWYNETKFKNIKKKVVGEMNKNKLNFNRLFRRVMFW
jgi:hypothetical protein